MIKKNSCDIYLTIKKKKHNDIYLTIKKKPRDT